MSWDILATLGSVMSILFAITFAYAGVELLFADQLLAGTGLLGVAIGTMLLERYVVTIGDLPALVAGRLLDGVDDPPDEK